MSTQERRIRVVAEGLVAGLLGGVAVIGVFLIHDAVRGDALLTPSVLNALLFEGADAARQVEGELAPALVYGAVHLLAWLAAGLLAAVLIHLVERHPAVWQLGFVAVAGAYAAVLWVEGALGVPGLGRFHLLAGALIGSGVMLTWLWWRHPEVLERLDDAYER